MIYIIFDCTQAERAANELADILRAKRRSVSVLNANEYIPLKNKITGADKTIFIGHDLLAERELRRIGSLEYDLHGMKYSFNGNSCVLSVDRKMSFGKQTEFIKYAEDRVRFYANRDFKLPDFYPREEDDMETAAKELISDIKDEFCDGDNSASGILAKIAAGILVSPLAALAAIVLPLGIAAEKGSAALDRTGILPVQYKLLTLEFETYGLSNFLESTSGKVVQKRIATKSAIVAPLPIRAVSPPSARPQSRAIPAYDELDELIGLEGVKKTVREIVTFLRKRGRSAFPCLHMVFRGNPGTAKTTVARIISRIFAQAGISEKNVLVETDRTGLVGGYIGQTALKTEKQIEKAMGGVLFIDEAYSLFAESGNDYGNEAVATLVKAMEDKRDKFICILAGYPDEMNAMIDMNPGLRNRVQFYIDFPDYTAEEMMRMFKKFCADNRYKLNKTAEEALAVEIAKLVRAKGKNFSNGRLVRKIFERVRIKQAQRADDSVITVTDIKAAFAEKDIEAMAKGDRALIGFAAGMGG